MPTCGEEVDSHVARPSERGVARMMVGHVGELANINRDCFQHALAFTLAQVR
jgi:hypothetical protein